MHLGLEKSIALVQSRKVDRRTLVHESLEKTNRGLESQRTPAFQGFVFTSAEIILPTPMSPLGIPGTTTMEFAVPNSRPLIGVTFFQQVLTVPRMSTVGRLSRGGIGVVGK